MIRKEASAILIAILFLSVAPAMAGLQVHFDIAGTKMTLTDGVGGATHGEILLSPTGIGKKTIWPKIQASLQQVTTATVDVFDWAEIVANTPDEQGYLALGLDFVGSGDDWTATGSMSLKDSTGDIKVEGGLVSTRMEIVNNQLRMDLALSTFGDPASGSILVPSSDPWEYYSADEDWTISLPSNVSMYDDGAVFVMQHSLPGGITSLSELLAHRGAPLGGGSVEITVHTPLPAALLLGVLGLGAAGLKLRKFV